MTRRFIPADIRHGKMPDLPGEFPFAELPPVQRPVDVSNASAFPNIAEAIRFAREMRRG